MKNKLETDRLIIRPLTVEDAHEIHGYFSDPAVYEHIPPNPSTSLEETREKLGKIIGMSAKFGGSMAVIEKSSGQIIGDCGIFPSEIEEEAIEIAYRFAKSAWGKGYAVEAAKELLRNGFEEFDLERIIAITGPDHRASIRVMEKLGMKHIGKMEDEYGEIVVYEIHRKQV